MPQGARRPAHARAISVPLADASSGVFGRRSARGAAPGTRAPSGQVRCSPRPGPRFGARGGPASGKAPGTGALASHHRPRARTGPKLAGTLGRTQLPSSPTCMLRLSMLTVQFWFSCTSPCANAESGRARLRNAACAKYRRATRATVALRQAALSRPRRDCTGSPYRYPLTLPRIPKGRAVPISSRIGLGTPRRLP